MPMEPSVLPKPVSNARMKLFVWMPGIRPNSISGMRSARNTCQRHLAIKKSSTMMTPRNPTSASSGLVVTAISGFTA